MAIKVIAVYAKRLGLPGYSSHQFSISVETELTDLAQVQEESTRLYKLLQDSVDAEVRTTGFVPGPTYGMENNNSTNGVTNGNGNHSSNGNGYHGHRQSRLEDRWACTDGQRGLILRIVNENQLDKAEVESMAQQLFQVGVKECNKMQASQLIEELLEKVGKSSSRRGSRWRNQPTRS